MCLTVMFTARLDLSTPCHDIHCNGFWPFVSVYCRINRVKVAVTVVLGVEKELSYFYLQGASVPLDRVWF